MAASKVSVHGHVAVKVRKDLSGAGGSAPVAHEVADDAEEGDELHAGLLHARVGGVADEGGAGAGGFDVGEDGCVCVLVCGRRGRRGVGRVGDCVGKGKVGNGELGERTYSNPQP